MKVHKVFAVLGLAAAMFLSACGTAPSPAVSPSASPSAAPAPTASAAQTGIEGEWITYAFIRSGKAVTIDDFIRSTLYKISADGKVSFQGADASGRVDGTWKQGEDGVVSICGADGAPVYTFTLSAPGDGTAQVDLADYPGDPMLAIRTDTPVGRAALKERREQLKNISGSNEDLEQTMTAYVSPGHDGFIQLDQVIWVDGNDADALALYGIDPASVSDDYAIYDSDNEYYEYTIAANGSFTIISDGKKTSTDADGLQQAAYRSGGAMLAKVTTHGDALVSAEQIYVP